MPIQDTSEIKEKIVTFFQNRGPSLPVHVAKEINLSILFTSAFLSELFNENRLKTSHMRVGSSPIYYLSGQENSLENYTEHLKSKEKEAFLLLKDKKILKDSELEPAIRVAIREIKDFAIPFKINDEIWWRFFTADESEIKGEEIKTKPEEKIEEKEFDIFDKKEESKKISTKRAKPGEKFFEKIKEFLSRSSVEIISIEGLKKEELILKIKIKEEEQLLIAYNKKKIGEKEILKAAKKADEFNLKYSILSLGELPKKIHNLIEALQNIKNIGKVE